MSSRLIVLGSEAAEVVNQVFEDLQATLEEGELGSDLGVFNAYSGGTTADLVKNPKTALGESVVSLRSAQQGTVIVQGVGAVPSPSFDLLGWNLDLAASADLSVVYALDGAGMSADLLDQEITTFLARASRHHATVAGVVVSGNTQWSG